VFIGKPSNNNNEEGPKKSKDALPEIKFKADVQGYPMLPSWESIRDTNHQYKRYLIGRYLSEMYRV
jgi:hypothetical protein